jgi:hypothetical protein
MDIVSFVADSFVAVVFFFGDCGALAESVGIGIVCPWCCAKAGAETNTTHAAAMEITVLLIIERFVF